MTDSIRRFYDGLAASYDLMYADWAGGAMRQGEILERLVTGVLGGGPHRILDCSCGIGTQLIGLAPFGH